MPLPQTLIFENTPSPSMFKLVTRMPHRFPACNTMIPKEASLSGHEQREWPCLACGTVRITVLAKDGSEARREWRLPGEKVQVGWWEKPACEVVVAKKAEQGAA